MAKLRNALAESIPGSEPRFTPRDCCATMLAGICIFLLDACTLADGLCASFYILLLLWFGEHRRRKAILAGTAACIAATFFTYPLAHGLHFEFDPLLRRFVSCAVILAASPVIFANIRVQEALSQQEIFLNLTDHPIIAADQHGIVTFWNGAAERIYGWSRRQALGAPLVGLFSTRDPSPTATLRAAIAEHGYWAGELVHRAKAGASITVLSRRFSAPGGGILDIATDITRLRETEDRLRLSEARYRSIFDSVAVAIWEEDYSRMAERITRARQAGVLDFEQYCIENPKFVSECVRDVRITDVNASAMRMYDATSKDALMQSLENIYLPGSTGSFSKIIAAIANGEAGCAATTTARTLQGRRLTVLMSVVLPAPSAQMHSVLVSTMDDTQRREIAESFRKTEESLLRVQHMTALGERMAVIAHQVNHPLAAIITNSEAALRWLNRASPNFQEASEAIEAVIQNGISAFNVMAHLRTLEQRELPLRASFQLGALIRDACQLLEGEFRREHIRLNLQLGPDSSAVLGDRIEIEQVILNLLANAMEALAGRAMPREITIRLTSQAAQRQVQIIDNGPGFPQASLKTIFVPFQSTKSSGMGLGLAVSRAIITNHGGEISAVNIAGQGAMVQFTLARSEHAE